MHPFLTFIPILLHRRLTSRRPTAALFGQLTPLIPLIYWVFCLVHVRVLTVFEVVLVHISVVLPLVNLCFFVLVLVTIVAVRRFVVSVVTVAQGFAVAFEDWPSTILSSASSSSFTAVLSTSTSGPRIQSKRPSNTK